MSPTAFIYIFVSLLVSGIRAFPNLTSLVTDKLCGSMTPGHNFGNTQIPPFYPSQSLNTNPFMVMLGKNNCYMSGQPLTISIMPSSTSKPMNNNPMNMTSDNSTQTNIAGLFVIVKKANNLASSFGTFNTQGFVNLNTGACFGNPNGTIFHVNCLDVSFINFTWTTNTTDSYMLYATIVHETDTFWVNVTYPINPCSESNKVMVSRNLFNLSNILLFLLFSNYKI